MKRFGKSAFFVALVVLVATLFAGTAMAATTYTWDNSGVGDNWDTPDNWDKDASYPGAAAGDTAIFDDPSKIPAGGVGNIYLIAHPLALLDVKGNVALTLKCGTNDKDIIADAGKMSVAAGSTLKFAVGGGANPSPVIGKDGEIAVEGTLTTDSGTAIWGKDTPNGAFKISGGGMIEVNNLRSRAETLTIVPGVGKTLKFASPLTKDAGDVKQQGNVVLTGKFVTRSSFPWKVEEGMLSVPTPASLKKDGNEVSVNLGSGSKAGTLHFEGDGNLVTTVHYVGTKAVLSVASGKTVTISAADRLVSAGSWEKAGSGTLRIDAKQTDVPGAGNTFTVSAGTLYLGASDAVHPATGKIKVLGTGSLGFSSGLNCVNAIDLDAGSTLKLQMSGTPEATFGATFATAPVVNGNVTVNAIGLKALLVPANVGKTYKVAGGDCSHFSGKVSLQADGMAVTSAMADVTAGAGGITVKVKAAPATSGDKISITGFPDDTSILYGVKDGKPQSVPKSFTIVTTNGKSATVTFSPDLPDWIEYSKGEDKPSGTNVTRTDTLTVTPKNAGESYQGKLVVKAGTASLERSFRVKKADETPGPKDPTTPGDDSYISAVGGGAMVPASPLKWELISYAPDNSNYRPVTITVSFWADQYPEHVQVATTGFIGDVRSEVLDYRRNAPSAGMKEYVLRVHGRVASQALDYGGAAITSIHFRFPGESAATWTRYIVIPGNGIKLADMTKLSYDRYYDHGGGGCDAGFGLGGAIVLLAAAGAAALRKRG